MNNLYPLSLNRGSVRSLLAIGLTSAIGGALIYGFIQFPEMRKEILVAMVGLVNGVVAYYFGSRTAEK